MEDKVAGALGPHNDRLVSDVIIFSNDSTQPVAGESYPCELPEQLQP